MIIAIDGPAGSGKSTIARCIAKKLGFLYIDTGAIYRALTLKALDNNISFKDETGLIQMSRDTRLDLCNSEDGAIQVILDGKDVSGLIRSLSITQHVSDLARISRVRQELLRFQRDLGNSTNSVIDGRDIGTVVFPDAERKFFLDADFNERVRRRFKELTDSGKNVMLTEIEADIKNRDRIDSTRSCAPLKKADDAIYVDTTNMSIDEVIDVVLKEIQKGIQENRLR